MLKVLSNILCDLDPKVKVIGQKAGICDGVPSTSALVISIIVRAIQNRSGYFQSTTCDTTEPIMTKISVSLKYDNK